MSEATVRTEEFIVVGDATVFKVKEVDPKTGIAWSDKFIGKNQSWRIIGRLANSHRRLRRGFRKTAEIAT